MKLHSPLRWLPVFWTILLSGALFMLVAPAASAQTFRFSLRADPDVIPANGISTTAILVQIQDTGGASIQAAPIVRFLTSAGTIESQARLQGGIARVLLRSNTTPGTAVITAFVGNAREQIAVEFAADDTGLARYLDISGSYVAYGDSESVITASGRCALEFGDLRIESDVRLDLDMRREMIWAQGNPGHVLIRNGRGGKAKELHGDRLFFDLRRRRGVMRRTDPALGAARQEFMGADFRPIPRAQADEIEAPVPAPGGKPPVAARKDIEDSTPVIDSTSRPGDATPPASSIQSEAAPSVEPPADAAAGPDGAARPVEPSRVHLSPRDRGKDDSVTLLSSATVRIPVNGEAAPADGAATTDPATMSASPVLRGTTARPLIAPSLTDGATGASSGTSTAGPEGGNSFGIIPRLSLVPREGDKNGDRSKNRTRPGDVADAPQQAPTLPDYQPVEGESSEIRVQEAVPPSPDINSGYWVAARRMLVYPHDRIQAEKATLFLNGGKVFSLPRYVVPLNGAFNPAQDMLSFNSSAGLTLNVPYYYMASPRGQGTVYFQHAPGQGFAAEKPGFALALEQQYWMSDHSNGKLIVDQIGRGGYNVGWEHKFQLTDSTNARLSLDMPRHRDVFMRSALYKDLKSMQLGMEGFLSKPNGGENDFQGQFFARMRPRQLGRSGWTMSVSANLSAWNRYGTSSYESVGGRGGGGVGLPGNPTGPANQLVERYRPALGQTFDISFQGPQRRLWKGASLDTTMRATAYNHSIGGAGAAPGLNLGFNQQFGRLASMRFDYTYDKSGGFFNSVNGVANVSHFVSGAFTITPTSKISASLFATQSLSDSSLYGTASLDYAFAPKWRAGLFADYSHFDADEALLDYGLSLGRTIGQREISINWDKTRGRFYFELGGFRY